MDADFWIKHLGMVKHPEGGFYKETYRCSQQMVNNEGNVRNVSTAIYFLLSENEKSHFHRIKSDELWFFQGGGTLNIFVLDEDGLETFHLGNKVDQGETMQLVVPAGKWFAASLKEKSGYALVSCTVAPGFDFKDFELAKYNDLILMCPNHEQLLKEMCIS